MKSAWKRFLRNWKYQARLQVATTSVLAGTFCVLILAFTLFSNLSETLRLWGSEIHVTAYLQDRIDRAEVTQLADTIKTEEGVADIQYVSAQLALERFRLQMSDYLPDFFFEESFENPLPESFEISLREDFLSKGKESAVKQLTEKIRHMKGIEDISFGFSWLNDYSKLVQAVSFGGSFLILVLLVGGVFVIGNSVNQSVHQKRDEIEILELFGATRKSIVVPFVVEGALLGFTSGLTALLLSFLGLRWLKFFVESDLMSLGMPGLWKFLGLGQILAVSVCCTLLGALGAFLFVRRMTTGWAAAQRGEL